MTAARTRIDDPRQTTLDLGAGVILRVQAPQPQPIPDNDNAVRARLAPQARRSNKWAEPGSRARQLGMFDHLEWRPHVGGRSYSVVMILRAIGEDPTSGQQRKKLTEEINQVLERSFHEIWQQKGEEEATLWLWMCVRKAKSYALPEWCREQFLEYREEIAREFVRDVPAWVEPNHDTYVEDRAEQLMALRKRKAVRALLQFYAACRKEETEEQPCRTSNESTTPSPATLTHACAARSAAP